MHPTIRPPVDSLLRMFHDFHKKVSTSSAAAVRSPPDFDGNAYPPYVSANNCAANCWPGCLFRDATAVTRITPCTFSQSIALLTSYWGYDTVKWAWISVLLRQNGQDFTPRVFLVRLPRDSRSISSWSSATSALRLNFERFSAVRLPCLTVLFGDQCFPNRLMVLLKFTHNCTKGQFWLVPYDPLPSGIVPCCNHLVDSGFYIFLHQCVDMCPINYYILDA